MRRGVPTIPLAPLALVLGGGALPGAAPSPAVRIQAGFYACRLVSQDVATPGPDVRLIVHPVNQQGQLPLRV